MGWVNHTWEKGFGADPRGPDSVQQDKREAGEAGDGEVRVEVKVGLVLATSRPLQEQSPVVSNEIAG